MIRRSIAAIAAPIVVLLTLSPEAGATPYPLEQFAMDLDDALPSFMERYDVPGAAAAVVFAGSVLSTTSDGLPAGKDVFKVASLTKTATALAILRLVEAGRIDLDRPVNDYLTRWNVRSKRFDVRGVTARRLLGHTAGLPFGYSGEDPPDTYPKLEDILDGKTRVPEANPEIEPGTKFKYSNAGYGVVELLLEEVTDMGYTEAMRDLVFEPLEMKNTGFQDDERLMERLVPGFLKAGTPKAQSVNLPRAAGGMLSTADDIGRLLNGVTYSSEDGGLLTEASLIEMRELEGPSKGAFGLSDGGYGLGIARSPLPSGRMFIANQGSHDDYQALMLSVPEAHTGWVVLTNSGTGIGVQLELALEFFDDVIGEQPAIAGVFMKFRARMIFGILSLTVIAAAWLIRVASDVRAGRRRWLTGVRARVVLLRTLPLAMLRSASS
ncbi:MAG: serine hydrolase domain-containing protein [Actinomycetota bacterium]